jgi:hypothetical protein
VSSTGNALPKHLRKGLVVLFRPRESLMVSDKTPGKFLVAICALIGESLLQPSGQLLALPALRLRETLRGLPEFVRMGNLLAGGQREEMQKAWSNANFPYAQRRNTVRVCVDAQA